MTAHIVSLAGGVGGARLARGFEALDIQHTVIVNTGDDFQHMGLHVSPDIDTVLYTLSGQNDEARGWGLLGESWAFMEQATRLGLPDWFALGDKDLALHVLRTARLAKGATLSEITAEIAARFGIRSTILPMSDRPAPTMVATDEGEMGFQSYFVGRRCEPVLRGLRFGGTAPTRQVRTALDAADAVVLCPSNPWLSIDPILALEGIRAATTPPGRPVIAVSPIIGGAAVKGPAGKIMAEKGLEVSAVGIAEVYAGLATHLVIDRADADLAKAIARHGIEPVVTDTLMRGPDDSAALARHILTLSGGAS